MASLENEVHTLTYLKRHVVIGAPPNSAPKDPEVKRIIRDNAEISSVRRPSVTIAANWDFIGHTTQEIGAHYINAQKRASPYVYGHTALTEVFESQDSYILAFLVDGHTSERIDKDRISLLSMLGVTSRPKRESYEYHVSMARSLDQDALVACSQEINSQLLSRPEGPHIPIVLGSLSLVMGVKHSN